MQVLLCPVRLLLWVFISYASLHRSVIILDRDQRPSVSPTRRFKQPTRNCCIGKQRFEILKGQAKDFSAHLLDPKEEHLRSMPRSLRNYQTQARRIADLLLNKLLTMVQNPSYPNPFFSSLLVRKLRSLYLKHSLILGPSIKIMHRRRPMTLIPIHVPSIRQIPLDLGPWYFP